MGDHRLELDMRIKGRDNHSQRNVNPLPGTPRADASMFQQEALMAAFITLGSWTDQGARAAKDALNRAQAAKKLAESMGGRFIGIWWTLGQYDFVVITEFPDDTTFARFAAAAAQQGNFRTSSLRAFSETEMQNIVSQLS